VRFRIGTAKRFQVEIDPDSEAIVAIAPRRAWRISCSPRWIVADTVLVPNPSYPIHMYGAVIAGADIRSVPLTPERDFFADLERAIRESYPKPKMIVCGFPSNPTAQCVELDFFERVIELARHNDILVVHDLAYADIVFDGLAGTVHHAGAGAKEVAVEFFTLSKSYNMAGWRVAFRRPRFAATCTG